MKKLLFHFVLYSLNRNFVLQRKDRMAKQKFYVVWQGNGEGVYTSWEACKKAVEGVSGSKYQSFKTEAEAEEAYEQGYENFQTQKTEGACSSQTGQSSFSSQSEKNTSSKTGRIIPSPRPLPAGAINEAIAVDAACSGNPGKMEYRGVYLRTGKEIFHYGPVFGTNNIGEFLAIVHGLALLKQKGLHTTPIYSDSVNAQLWVRRRKCKTTLERNAKTETLHQLIDRAEKWLHENTYQNPIIKWPTEEWGEIPADFGRK